MGVSRTFVPLSNPQDLLAKLRQLTDLLEFELKKEDLSGRTVTLYFKSTTFEVKSRSRTIPRYIFESDDLYYFGKQILEAELPMKIRNLGIRLSTLHPREVERRCGIKRVLVNEQDGYNNKQGSLQTGPSIKKQRVKTLIKESVTNITEITDNNKTLMSNSDTQHLNINWDCPRCQKVFNNPSILRINSHLDNCLNRINTRQQNLKVTIKNNNQQKDSSLFNYFGR
ncbi:11641_t:CDS:2, partial [Diversispora eburnea]